MVGRAVKRTLDSVVTYMTAQPAVSVIAVSNLSIATWYYWFAVLCRRVTVVVQNVVHSSTATAVSVVYAAPLGLSAAPDTLAMGVDTSFLVAVVAASSFVQVLSHYAVNRL